MPPAKQPARPQTLPRSLSLCRTSAALHHAPQVPDSREHFVIPVSALGVVGPLLVFHDLLILAEDVLREPGDERPYRMDQAGNGRLPQGVAAEGVCCALLRR